jgi:hypothetical protein
VTAQVFRDQVMKLLLGIDAIEIEIDDGEMSNLVFVGCRRRGEKYELSITADDRPRREKARDWLLDAVRRFADGK